jgi:thymidylate synthase ThyX
MIESEYYVGITRSLHGVKFLSFCKKIGCFLCQGKDDIKMKHSIILHYMYFSEKNHRSLQFSQFVTCVTVVSHEWMDI